MPTVLTEKKPVKKVEPVNKNVTKPTPVTDDSERPAHFSILERQEACEEFGRVFGFNLALVRHDLLTACLGEICIDAGLFDYQLKRRHPDFDWKHNSLHDAVRKYYGEEGMLLLRKML